MTTIKGPVDVDEMEIPKVTSKEDDIVPEPAEASNSTEGDDNDLDARNDTKVIQPSETSAEAEEKKAIEKGKGDDCCSICKYGEDTNKNNMMRTASYPARAFVF